MMRSAVSEAIDRYSLLEGVSRLTVAVSGGADSTALLHLCAKLCGEGGVSLFAAHFHHGIRGAEADRDEQFVRELCERLGVPLRVRRADVPAFAREHRMGLELAARTLRYRFFEEVREGGAVATAHTADDNLETVLFRLTRGSALEGLCGIPPKRGAYIRPLILCTREQVEAYCAENGLSFVTDSSNLSDDYTRNRLRHQVIPVIKVLNPEAAAAAARACRDLADVRELLQSESEAFLRENRQGDGLRLMRFPALSRALQTRVLKAFAESFLETHSLDARHIEQLLSAALHSGTVNLPEDRIAVSRGGVLTVRPAKETAAESPFRVRIAEESAGNFDRGVKVHNLLLKNTLDCDKIVAQWVLRTRQPGDAIQLPGRPTKTLKKLFTEKKVPVALREHWPVLADGGGLIWVYGFGAAERCAVTENTRRILKIEVSEET